MSEIENSRVIGIECFLKDEIFFLYSYFYKGDNGLSYHWLDKVRKEVLLSVIDTECKISE